MEPNEQATTEAGAESQVSGQEAQNDILEGAEQGGSQATTAAATTETQAAPVASSGLSKDDVSEILKGAFAQMPQQTAAPSTTPEPQMSQEDFEKAFNVYKASPELLAQLRSEDPKIALQAVHALRDGIIRQAMTMAEYRVQQHLEKLLGEHVAPLQSYVTEQQATSFRNDFFKKNPELEKYESLVDAVSVKLEKSGWKGKTRDEVFKKYAEETNTIVKQLLAAGGQNGGQAQTTTGSAAATPGKNRMSTLTGGGQQAGGQRQAPGSKGPPGVEVFDE